MQDTPGKTVICQMASAAAGIQAPLQLTECQHQKLEWTCILLEMETFEKCVMGSVACNAATENQMQEQLHHHVSQLTLNFNS